MAEPRHCSPIVASSQGTQGSNQYRRTSFHKCDRSRRSWSDKEEVALMAALKELVAMGWKLDNGFRLSYYVLQHDSNAKHMRGKSWPFWEDWKEVFGKDRAIGGGSEGVKHATRQSMHDPIPEENIVDLGLNNDYHVSFDDFISMEEVQQQQVRGSSSGEGSTTHNEKETRAPKKSTLKRKSSDDGDELLTLLRTLHAETILALRLYRCALDMRWTWRKPDKKSSVSYKEGLM
ncbi:hypothetical protein AAHA92_31160 [Salvia divinorum]|uniref:Myb/SANT-like domain-containing protein n=1 Tax=Salvia divinorum TaxID=28513 RepID=A0ABD1FT87_SALDI